MIPRRACSWACILLMCAATAVPLPSAPQQSDVPSDPLARLVDQFGEIYKQGRYADAAKIAAQILAVLQQTRGPDDLDLAANLNNLGSLAYAQGQLQLAEPFYRGALAIYEKRTGPDSANVADVLYNLAGLLVETGRGDDAASLYQRCLVIRRSVLGPKHPLVAEVLNNVGFLHLSQGRLGQAETALVEAFDIWKDNVGTDAPYAAVTLTNLSQLRTRQRRLDEAELLCKQALDLEKQIFGPDHPEVATTLTTLARIHEEQGQSEEAAQTYAKAVAILEGALGPADPLTIQAKARMTGPSTTNTPAPPASTGPGLGEYQILVVATQAEATALHGKLSAGESFEALARAHSLDASAKVGGVFNADPANLNEALRSQLDALPAGGFSGVFAVRSQWAIVRKIRDP